MDEEIKVVFDIRYIAEQKDDHWKRLLGSYKVALHPNRHPAIWEKISQTIYRHRGSVNALLSASEFDFLKLKECVQEKHKKGFPYLSGPKIFHYRSYILGEYAGIQLKNRDHIAVVPDTHVIQASRKLGLLKEKEELLKRDEISQRWKSLLAGSEISPIDMSSPLWFRSRNNFQYRLEEL